MGRTPGGMFVVAPTNQPIEGLVPEKLSERLQEIHAVVQAVLAGDLTRNVSIHPKYDSFSALERDMYNMVNKIKEMKAQNEMAVQKIKEALSEIIQMTNFVKEATESIKAGKFDVPFEAESSISEIRELKKRFQYLISVIRLLSVESAL